MLTTHTASLPWPHFVKMLCRAYSYLSDSALTTHTAPLPWLHFVVCGSTVALRGRNTGGKIRFSGEHRRQAYLVVVLHGLQVNERCRVEFWRQTWACTCLDLAWTITSSVWICTSLKIGEMMMINFITFNSTLVPLIKGLCSSNPCEFEISSFRRNRTDDLEINSSSLWPTEPCLHVRSQESKQPDAAENPDQDPARIQQVTEGDDLDRHGGQDAVRKTNVL